ncbi:MAG: insulinase family protein [Acidobacteria bacterium]|nr:insulinase family protein [Acidobacteriota bacterium]
MNPKPLADLPAAGLKIPIERYTLPNGMRVVLSADNAAPVVAVYLIYGVGARSEEKGRTGFAHLFEHMMFQGSENAPKGVLDKLVEGNGGIMNGSTHPDFTDYFEVLPSNKLPVALWLEADRMRGLKITKENLDNQREAVKQERRLRADNQPYVTAIVDNWPALAFRNWGSSHSLIGSFEDLEAATVDDVARFFKTYYAPNNAVLAIVGDIQPAEAKKWIETYFAGIPGQPQPKHPDLTEPEQTAARREVYKDKLARVPMLVAGYSGAPQRRSADYRALVMLDLLLTGGDSSRLYLNLVKGKQSVVQFEANLGWPFASPPDYKDPGLYALSLVHKPNFTGAQILAQVEAEIARIQKDGVPAAELQRARTFLRAQRMGQLQSSIQRATLLGQYELFDANPDWINTELAGFLEVTPEAIQAAARTYLIPARRNVLEIQPEGK